MGRMKDTVLVHGLRMVFKKTDDVCGWHVRAVKTIESAIAVNVKGRERELSNVAPAAVMAFVKARRIGIWLSIMIGWEKAAASLVRLKMPFFGILVV